MMPNRAKRTLVDHLSLLSLEARGNGGGASFGHVVAALMTTCASAAAAHWLCLNGIVNDATQDADAVLPNRGDQGDDQQGNNYQQ
jgi:hypothetical protein